jgi:HTH-type transcriptional repressor of NAD biosynthesis genes
MVETMVAQKKFVTGLVVGKFCPLHKGHLKVIETALDQCEKVVILSYTSENYRHCGSETRQKWLERAVIGHEDHATVRVIDELAFGMRLKDDAPEDEHRKFCADYLLNTLDTTVQAVFTSEDYGDGFADYLSLYFTANLLSPVSVKHVMVDKERKEFPISGTKLRESVMYMDKFVPWYVSDKFVRKVLFLGGESTGKTTLVNALGDSRHSVMEFGRYLFDQREGKLQYEDMAYIAKCQLEAEEYKAANLLMSEVLYCDTSPLTTKWFGRVAEELNDMVYESESAYYKVFLCAPDFPMVQDGTRKDEKFRMKGHEFFIRELGYAGIEYTLLTGSLEERVIKVKQELF